MSKAINPAFDRDGWCRDMASVPDRAGVEYLYGPFLQDGVWWVTWRPDYHDATPVLSAFGERMARPVAWRLPRETAQGGEA